MRAARRAGAIVTLVFVTASFVMPASAQQPSASRNVRVVAHFPYMSGTDIDFSEQYAFFTQQGTPTGRVRVVDISKRRPELTADFVCGGTQNDVAVIEPDVIALGSHWGACQAQPASGINLLDVSDPSSPQQLGFWPIAGGTHTLTKHPTEQLVYTSSAGGFGGDPRQHIVDVSDPMLPRAVGYMGTSCHDVSFHLSRRAKLAFCAAGGSATEIWDVEDPTQPEVLARIVDREIGYHHLAVATPDGRFLVVGDESSGSSCSGETRQREPGALSIYNISNPRQPKMAGFINPPRGPAVCWVHNFNFVPGTRFLVTSWWRGGTSVYDLRNPSRAREIAYYKPDDELVWSSYWHDGRIYTNGSSGAHIIEVRGLRQRG